MAHSATISGLASDLITSIAGPSVAHDARKFRRTKDAVSRGLRTQQWTRTNQFDVQASYEGLVEKFFVLDRSDLADALEVRLKELEKKPGRWTPEILSLFLHLSANAVEKARVENLELLKPPKPPPELTWAEIIADDPLDEEGIWDDIDYAAESSEEEPVLKPRKRGATIREPSPATSVEEDDFASAAERFILAPNPETLTEIAKSQFWTKDGQQDELITSPLLKASGGKKALQITELQAIRETLFMLNGLPTSLFRVDKQLKRVDCSDLYVLTHARASTWKHQLQELASIGRGMLQLRSWAREKQSIALLQTFQAAVVQEIREFDKHLAQLQSRYLGASPAVAVSLTEITAEIQTRVEPLLRLNDLISVSSQFRSPFIFLEALYNQVNLSQVVNESALFQFLARIFFQCLQTYLKPIRKWMENGELGIDDQIFFVGTADKSSEAASLWHDQYVLRRDSNGRLHAPNFLQPAAKKIFNSGKSVVFLKELGSHDIAASSMDTEPRLDFEVVCGKGIEVPLAPFSELFDMKFEDWIRSKYTLASSILRQHLHSGLWQSLDALEYIYFSRDGSLMQTFADTVFEKLDRGRSGWNDRYLLTEIARSIYGIVPSINADKLAIRVASHKEKGRTVKTLGSISVDYILSWSIMNVIQRSSINIYQRISVFILQVYRARYVLRTSNIWRGSSDSVFSRRIQYYLRHRLLWFTDILHSYLTETVIWPATSTLRKELADAEDIDVMAALHTEHIQRLENQCLLTKQLAPIHDAIISILDLSVLYSDTLSSETHNNAIVHARPPIRRDSSVQYRRQANRRASGLPATLSLQSDSESDSEAENEGKGNGVASGATNEPASGPRQGQSMAQMRDQFEQLYGFVAVGLRGVSRAGGERCWEILAERLEWDGNAGKGSAR